MFENVEDVTSGTWADGKTTLGTADGFQIQENSPAVDAGAAHPDAPNSAPSAVADELVPNETEKPIYDYYGDALADGTNDIGADEYVEEVVVNKEALAKAISDAEALDRNDYTADSYAAVETALQEAKAVYDDAEATQMEVDAAAAALTEAIEALQPAEQPAEVDKSDLQELYDTNRDLEQGQYTDASYGAFLNALADAEKVLADADATQEEVDAALDALTAALNGLEVAETPSGSQIRDELQKLYDSCRNLAQGSFTDSSYKAFTDALANAQAVLANENATEQELKDAYIALAQAVNGLTVDQAKPGSGSSSAAVDSTKTGDTAPVAVYTIIVLIALGAAVCTVAVRRRRRG